MTEREEWEICAQEALDLMTPEHMAAVAVLTAKVKDVLINAHVQRDGVTVYVSFKTFAEMQKAYERVVGL